MPELFGEYRQLARSTECKNGARQGENSQIASD